MEERKEIQSDRSSLCKQCGVDTWKIHEYYMVIDEIWSQATEGDGILCIGCLEKGLGRKLESKDFSPTAVTNFHSILPPFYNPKSERLRDRLGELFTTPEEEEALFALEIEIDKQRLLAYYKNPKAYEYVAIDFPQELTRIRRQMRKQMNTKP